MYIGHGHLRVCLSVCLSVPCHIPTLLHGPGCNLENGSKCSLVVHYRVDLQSEHRFCCYDNIHICKLTATLQMHIVPNTKYQRVLVLALWPVNIIIII